MSALGFKAINTSLYDRSFAIYEAITCAIRTSKKPSRILTASSLFPQEIEVLETTAKTEIKFDFLPSTTRQVDVIIKHCRH